MKEGIVFDFDGVIINSFELQKKALTESYQIVVGEGEPSIEEFFRHSGDSLENIFRKMNLPKEMVKHYREISRNHLDYILVYDGMPELLANLTDRGFLCALCTGKERNRTLEILRLLKLEQYFCTIVCSDDVKRAKPNPDSLELALSNMEVKSQNAVMIGDAPNDILCGKSIAVKGIGVTWGEVNKELLLQSNPDYVVDTVEELQDTINHIFS